MGDDHRVKTTTLTVLGGFQSKCCREEDTAIVRVYVERPRKLQRRAPPPNDRIIRRDQIQRQGVPVEGYSRRAELLHYCRQLRESVRSGQGTPPIPRKSVPADSHQPPTKLRITIPHLAISRLYQHCCVKISQLNRRCSRFGGLCPLKRNPGYNKAPTCLGNYRILTTNFLASRISSSTGKGKKKRNANGSASKKVTTGAVMKSSELKGQGHVHVYFLLAVL